ncbi:MAG: hypothetical protein JHD02_07100 [Thermoleophilaceae bacterium]|nr:hypothetical protein [Thermoleophilaceae bacterium]
MLALAGTASAKVKYTYQAQIRPAAYSVSPNGSVQIGNLNPALSYTIRVTLGGVPQAALNYPLGDTARYVTANTLAPGDTVTVEQPTGVTQETFTVPNVSISGAAGSPNLSGNAPDGGATFARYEADCGLPGSDAFPVQPLGGSFSVSFPQAMTAGGLLTVTHLPGQGDRVIYESRIPGETPCLEAHAYLYPAPPDAAVDPDPYTLRANSLRPLVATGARLVLRRGGAIVVDYTSPSASTAINTDTAVQPLPGDALELYRPHTALVPSATFSIPSTRATYDTSNSLVAVDAPAAALLRFNVSSIYAMWENSRTALSTSGGRTLFNFAVSDGPDPGISLAGREVYTAEWVSADGHGEYIFGGVAGDLAAPVLSLKLANKFRLAKIRKSLSASLTSNEASTASLKLTIPSKLKTSAAGKSSTRTLAASNVSVGAGTTKVKLKLTKSARKLLAKLIKGRYPDQKATLTVAATDFSGNVSTTVKTTKLVRK